MTDRDADRSVQCAIAVMAKASIPGRTKTRLAPPLSAQEAADCNTAFLRDITENLRAAALQAPIQPAMAFAPAGSEAFFRSTLGNDVTLVETVRPTFGECLFHAVSQLLELGYGSACVLNSDSPTLPASYLVSAATLLATPGDRVVVGPSIDGGYYLLGVKQAHHRLFEDVDWSTEHVFRQTIERAEEIGVPVIVLPSWYDVDDVMGLRLLADEVLRGLRFRPAGKAPVSARYSRAILEDLLRQPALAQIIDTRPSRVA